MPVTRVAPLFAHKIFADNLSMGNALSNGQSGIQPLCSCTHANGSWKYLLLPISSRKCAVHNPTEPKPYLDMVQDAVSIEIRVKPGRWQMQFADRPSAVQVHSFDALFQMRHQNVGRQTMVRRGCCLTAPHSLVRHLQGVGFRVELL